MSVHLLNKMKNLFLKSGDSESEDIDLDNFDKAKLVRNGNTVEAMRENGVRFPITDLSEDEISVFIYLLEH
jgi:hypothetical protein